MNPWVTFLFPLLWCLGIFLGSRGVGRLIFRGLGFKTEQAVTEEVFSLGLGLAALSYLVFTFSALHWLSPGLLKGISTVWILAGLLLLFFQRPVLRRDHWIWFERVLLAALVITGLLNLLYALTPAVDWDGVAYHLALPKIYLQAGGLVFRPDIFHNLFPQFTEMLYLLSLSFPYGIGAKLLHYGFGVLAAAAVFACCRESGLKTAAWLGATIFYLQFIVHIESSTAFIELASAAYVALALLAFLMSRQAANASRWQNLCFFFLGVSAATKWHGLIIVALAGALLFAKMVREQKKIPVRPALGLVFWGSLGVWPYFIRAWIMGGNPVWPLGYRFFGGRYWDQAMADQVMAFYKTGWTGLTTGAAGFFRLPYDLVRHGSLFGVGGFELQAPIAGGFLLLGAWLFQLTRPAAKGRRWPSLLTGAAGLLFLWIWFQSSPQIRFLVPLFPVLAWLAARRLGEAWQTKSLRIFTVVSGLLLLVVHPPVHRDTPYQFQALMGKISAGDFITYYLPHYPACQYLNSQVKPGEKILLFGENRGFYLEPDYLWGDPFGQCVLDYRRDNTPESLLARLQALGIRWVLYRTDLYDEHYLNPGVVHLMASTLAQGGEPAATFGPVTVVRLVKKQN